MIPSSLVKMDSFPLTINGKLDKKGLPAPEFTVSDDLYVAPTTETEKVLCRIWEEVLGLDRVGITDDFFRIGGDSILSIQVSSRIRQIGLSCNVRDIFESRSISRLIVRIESKDLDDMVEQEQGILEGDFSLLPIQQWFLERTNANLLVSPNHWNQSFLVRTPELDVIKLGSILDVLVSHHDMLRVCYDFKDDSFELNQRYESEVLIPELKTLDVSLLSAEAIHLELTKWQSDFDLESGPLFRVGYLHGYEDGSARIYFALHHMLVDGVSWRILADDLKRLYLGDSLGQKGSSYRQWVSRIRNYAKDTPEEGLYWESRFKGIPDYSQLVLGTSQSTFYFDLEESTTRILLQDISTAYYTEINDLLLTALGYALKDVNGLDIQGITLEGHGREPIDPAIDHSHTLGWFTSIFPVKLELKDSLRGSIQFIKDTLHRVPNKGIGFGSFAVSGNSTCAFSDLAPISFNYLGQFEVGEELRDWDVITSEDSGSQVDSLNTDHNILNINGGVQKGRLGFRIDSKLGTIATEDFGKNFKRHLISIIDHCKESLAESGSLYTSSDFESVDLSQSLLDDLQVAASSTQNSISGIYPASSLQQGFIYHAISQPDDDAYRVQLLLDYHDELDVDKYLQAWEYCIRKYPILRTSFNWEEELVQVVYNRGDLEYELHDISELKTQLARDEKIKSIQLLDRGHGFDLTKPSLFRLHIIKQSETLYTILKTDHHSIGDGWSGPALLKSLDSYYESLIVGDSIDVKEDVAYLETQEYIYTHKSVVSNYWDGILSEVEGANDINALLSNPIDLTSYRIVGNPGSNAIEIKGSVYEELKSFSQREGVTINVIVQFIWHKLLQVYSSSPHSIVGTTVSGRDLPIEGIEESVGLFINTLPLVVNWDNDNSILSQLHDIQKQITGLNSNSFADLSKLQKGEGRLFHSLFVFENYPMPKGTSSEVSKLSIRDAIEKVDYPLSIKAYEYSDVLTIELQYDGDYLTEEKANSHLVRLEDILDQVINTPDQLHSKISLLNSSEYDQVIHQWNSTDVDYPRDKTIYEMFESQVENVPDNIALVYEDKELTYNELNERSNELARHIRSSYKERTGNDLKPDTLIALCLDRSLEMIIGILGVLKAGGAYVPIDQDYPQDRIDYILEDTEAALILSQRGVFKDRSTSLPEDRVVYIDLIEGFYQKEQPSNLPRYSRPTDLAYVIYTSGTTGKPKGVMVEHEGVNNLVFTRKDTFKLDKNSRVLQYASLVFDASVCEIFSALSFGSSLLIASKNVKEDTQLLSDYIERHQITIATIPPALLGVMKYKKQFNLKTLIVAGEITSSDVMKKWSVGRTLINAYGPTENTVCTTIYNYLLEDLNTNIGSPISNTRVYVLDKFKQVVPIGVIGELYIGGAGLSRGYLNNPNLTEERFIENPFATDEDREKGYTRLYRTGDLVRWLSDGNLEYIGRNDDQVKIRGYRIELGEIEYALRSIEGITQSCVIAKGRETETGTIKYLVGYYVLDVSDVALSEESILESLSLALPDYMIPSSLVKMDSFPLTINGKLDKKGLPAPEFTVSDDLYVAPTTETEKVLCRIWEEVLGLDRVGITDDFFRIGGDSILSIQVSSRIRQIGLSCNVRDIFESRSISRLIVRIESKDLDDMVEQEQGILEGDFSLLPIQQWFLERTNANLLVSPNHWNQSFLVRTPELDVIKLGSILDVLVSHHDMLRVCYDFKDDSFELNQRYESEVLIPELKTLDVSLLSAEAIHLELTKWQSDFDLESGPLFRVGYLHGYEDGSARIYFALHHMLVDGVSWRILADDLKRLYLGDSLGQKGSSYRQWVSRIRNYAKDTPEEGLYWESRFKGIPDYSQLVLGTSQSTFYFDLEESTTRILLQDISTAYYTEINDLLLTALGYALKDVNGLDIQGITLEGHGREPIDPAIDHSHTLGWFTSIFPVKLELKDSLRGSIQFIKDTLHRVPNKGIGFGSFAVSGNSTCAFSDLAPISFNYLGQFEVGEELRDWDVITSEDSGSQVDSLNTDHNILNINGGVQKGRLGFRIDSKLGTIATEDFGKNFKRHLISIIDHCKESLAESGSLYTSSDFESVDLSQSLLDDLQVAASSTQNSISGIYPASSLQQGFIYHAISQPDDDAYRVQLLLDYHDELDVDKYLQAWEYCIRKYPILRTSFNWEEELVQVVYNRGDLEYELHDISELKTQLARDEKIKSIQLLDRGHGFDLTKPSLFRLHIIKQSETLYTILKTDHHSIGDGWSGPALLKSLDSYYESLIVGDSIDVKEDVAYLETQEYIYTHKSVVSNYWDGILSEVEGANDINALLSNPIDLTSYRIVGNPGSNAIEIKGSVYEELKSFSQREGVTINVIVQFIWHKLLQVYSSSPHSIVGTTVSGRDLPIEGIEESVGLFINTLPLVVNWDNDNSILSQLHDIQKQITGLNSNSFADLSKLQKGEGRLFHSLFIFQNYPMPKGTSSEVSKLSTRGAIQKSDYPLNITVYEYSDVLTIELQYDGDYLTEEKANSHLVRLEDILDQVINTPDQLHSKISLLNSSEYDQVIHQWNSTDVDYPRDKTIYEMFESQVENVPDNIALVYEDKELTYNELNERSNELARHIRSSYKERTGNDLKPDTLIALCLDRSLEMIIGILGVLKAGGAYVPIDPDYPQDRIDYILEDTEAALVLSQRGVFKDRSTSLPEGRVVYIDLSAPFYKDEDSSNLTRYSTSTDLIYVIYTSGTTGKPKGVMVENKGVNNLINFHNKQYAQLSVNPQVALVSNYNFDFSVQQIFNTILFGHTLHVLSKDRILNPSLFNDYLIANEIEVFEMTPTLFSHLILPFNNYENSKLKFINIGGENLSPSIISNFLDKNISKDISIINTYGPTEFTVDATLYKIDFNKDSLIDNESVSIGSPISNTRVYVLDKFKQVVPIGVIGELYIGGAGLSRGYLNNPNLTEERFIENPFATDEDREKGYTRLYRTGDLVRWLSDGNLEYIGRNDDQVKIRGYRIELGEIEYALRSIEGITRSCVLVKESVKDSNTSKHLIGYYILEEPDIELSEEFIIEELSKALPEYMVPSSLIKMDNFPLTINGKLDKKALSDVEFGSLNDLYVAPTTETEKALCRIWEEVLGLERVGITDDFFKIGGDSILCITLSHRMSEFSHKDIQVSDIFEYVTISELIENFLITRVDNNNIIKEF
ncbi:amino acid adenylation domain protein [Nonlabens dokdonensis DSW-6]|uniref:Amino acid adenylation domain protein n=3 Tax=Nonlabens dokdonensis TaxID=328515 RepID=L7W1D0_NONDD|nr:amino acid adenylation domain protein [Nonlabens dokdonensis DSW-6]